MKKLLSLVLIFVLLFAALPVYAGEQKLIALTFDDGPSAPTRQLLKGLEGTGAHVTFFMAGYMASHESTKDCISGAYLHGHQVASHTWSHTRLTSLSADSVSSEVKKANDLLCNLIGVEEALWVRPPYGAYNATVTSRVSSPVILWSVDTRDWQNRNAEAVCNAILSKAKDGAIVLMHDLYASSVEGALAAIPKLQEQGFEVVTVKELARRKGVVPQAGEVYRQFAGETVAPAVGAVGLSYERQGSTCRLALHEESGAPIYYTLDGSDPVTQGLLYEGPIEATFPVVVRAVAAYDLNGDRGPSRGRILY